MNKQQIKDAISALQKLLDDEPKKTLVTKDDIGVFAPKIDEYYYYLDNGNYVESCKWEGDDIDLFRLSQNNVFRTEQRAEKCIEINARVQELIGDWVVDWGDYNQEKYSLFYSHERGKITGDYDFKTQHQGATYMPYNAVITLIEEFGDDLLIWMGLVR